MPSFDDVLRLYDYVLPPERIAQVPATPRDSAKLLVFERATGKTTWTTFRRIGDFLPKKCVLVLNQTKVIPARLHLTRSTGGRVEVLSLGAVGRHVRVMANRKLRPGETLTLTAGRTFTVAGSDGTFWLLTPDFPIEELQRVFERHGHMPLPPYIDQSPLSPRQLKQRYQSVFARMPGSIAAPTASLHFTPRLLRTLERQGIRLASVTLHVHLGTFARLTEEQWERGELHEESYEIDPENAELLESAKRARQPIIAVGTTVVRTLESAFDADGRCIRPRGTTRLFIREGYRFRMVSALITNFHVPRSSLLILVSAFAGRERILALYQQAIAKEFRFFSFGDAMLVL